MSDPTPPRTNEFGQPIGPDLAGWAAPGNPPPGEIHGAAVALHPLEPQVHAPPLFELLENVDGSLWTYLPFGPFADVDQVEALFRSLCRYEDWQPFAVIVDDEPLGFCSYLRIQETVGSIEVGSIVLSPALQRTTAATEALYLLIRHAFELGYRRVEWKCDHLNAPSIAAAERLGFTFEGVFRKATHYKGRSRDTAWFAIVDDDWPEIDAVFRTWLAPDNFDADGGQIATLRELRNPG